MRLGPVIINANGPVVWEVAVCVGAGVVFAKIPVDGW